MNSHRLFNLVCASLLIVGTLLFLNGGRQHPKTDAAHMGGAPLGGEMYFRHFAEHIAAEPNWIPMHNQILAGPVLWLLGAVALRRRLRLVDDGTWSDLAFAAMLAGVVCWTIAFVFDGFASPRIARDVMQSPPERTFAFIGTLSANQSVVIRCGLVAWLLIGMAAAVFGGSLATRGGIGTRVLGIAGVILGIVPMALWIGGSYEPGPFVSLWWNPNAIATSLWFLALGIWMTRPEPEAVA